jgi:hypothetical protein
VRPFLIATVMASAAISGIAMARQRPCETGNIFAAMAAGASPGIRAQRDFEHAVCEYRNCIGANPNNANACEGLRHIMDASAQAAGHFHDSR